MGIDYSTEEELAAKEIITAYKEGLSIGKIFKQRRESSTDSQEPKNPHNTLTSHHYAWKEGFLIGSNSNAITDSEEKFYVTARDGRGNSIKSNDSNLGDAVYQVVQGNAIIVSKEKFTQSIMYDDMSAGAENDSPPGRLSLVVGGNVADILKTCNQYTESGLDYVFLKSEIPYGSNLSDRDREKIAHIITVSILENIHSNEEHKCLAIAPNELDYLRKAMNLTVEEFVLLLQANRSDDERFIEPKDLTTVGVNLTGVLYEFERLIRLKLDRNFVIRKDSRLIILDIRRYPLIITREMLG